MPAFDLDPDLDRALQRHIAREKIDLLVKGMKTGSVSSAVTPLLIIWLFYDYVAPALLWGPVLWIYAQHAERFVKLRT